MFISIQNYYLIKNLCVIGFITIESITYNKIVGSVHN